MSENPKNNPNKKTITDRIRASKRSAIAAVALSAAAGGVLVSAVDTSVDDLRAPRNAAAADVKEYMNGFKAGMDAKAELRVKSAEEAMAEDIRNGKELTVFNGTIVQQLPASENTRIINAPILVAKKAGKDLEPGTDPSAFRYYAVTHDFEGNPDVEEVLFDPTSMTVMTNAKSGAPVIRGKLIQQSDTYGRADTDGMHYELTYDPIANGMTDMPRKGGPFVVGEDFIASPDYGTQK